MKKNRNIYFKKIKHNIDIDYNDIIKTEIIPGFIMNLPNITYKVIKDENLTMSIITIIAILNKKKRKIKLMNLDFEDNDYCNLTIKSSKKDYINFCNYLFTLKKEEIERIEG